MRLEATLASAYADKAFDQMVAVIARVTDEQLNQRPHGPTTNSIAALVVHCAGVAEFWLGHVGLGRPSERKRDPEFSATATRAEVLSMIEVARRQVADDAAALADGRGTPSEYRELLEPAGDDDSLVLHVLEELYQHLGHMDLTADAFNAPT